MRTRTRIRIAVAMLAVAASVAAAAQPAHAEGPKPNGCVYEQDISTPAIISSDQHFPVGIDFKNGPGGKVYASTQYSLGASATVTVSGGASVSIVVAEANGSLSISGTVSSSISQTWGYEHDISPSKYGHLQFGNWGWKVSVKKEVWNTSCGYNVYNGSAKIPTVNVWGYRYWETSS